MFSNLAEHRLSPDQAGTIGSKEHQVTMDVRKPRSTEFIRVSTDPALSLECTVFTDDDGEIYYIMPNMRDIMVGNVKPVQLVLAVNQSGVPFIWSMSLGDGVKRNSWYDSAREGAKLAETKWIKMVSDMPNKRYRVYEAMGALPEPKFPQKSFEELLDLAFNGKIIDDLSHPVARRAQGYAP